MVLYTDKDGALIAVDEGLFHRYITGNKEYFSHQQKWPAKGCMSWYHAVRLRGPEGVKTNLLGKDKATK